MSYLTTVNFGLPLVHETFGRQVLTLLAPFGDVDTDMVRFESSGSNFLPQISFHLSSAQTPTVKFDTLETLEVELTNVTGEDRQSPEVYTPIEIDELFARLPTSTFRKLDHVGFNLPWFNGVHPQVSKLRESLALKCAYYRFPTGEEWDFILPATAQEIEGRVIDLSIERRPKLEIVSFDKSSTPLIQIDFSVSLKFEEIRKLFSEGIADFSLKNVWVYLKNPYGIDICLVIGEEGDEDWCAFFEGHRLLKGLA
jgi:hypothetical protein